MSRWPADDIGASSRRSEFVEPDQGVDGGLIATLAVVVIVAVVSIGAFVLIHLA